MADVGDMDVQGEIAVWQLVHPHGVVEITRGFAIDSYYLHAAEIAPAFELCRRDYQGYILGLLKGVRREAMRQVVLANHDLDVNAEIVRPAKDFDHAAYRGLIACGVFEQLDVDDESVHIADVRDTDRLHADAVDGRAAGRRFHPIGNLDPLANTLILRGDEVPAAPEVELAYHGRMSALQDLDDFAVGPAVSLDAGDLD